MITNKEFEKKQFVFVFLHLKEKISFSNDNLVVRDEDGHIKHQSTCARLFALFIVGHLTITTGFIQRSRKFGFPIVLMTPSLRVYDVIGHQMEGNVALRKLQYKYEGVELARHLIINKMNNQRWVLSQQRHKSENVVGSIQKLDLYVSNLASYTGELTGMLGIEGSASRIYFSNHFNNIQWNGRKPRIKEDYVNSALDIGYTLLFNFIESLLRLYGFDLYYGVLHKQFYMRKSLVCDLIEPIRPLVDLKLKKAISLKQITEEDFQIVGKSWQLKYSFNSKYVSIFMQPLLERKIDIFYYIQSYYRAFMKQKQSSQFPIFMMEEVEHDHH
jgi:CRISPR-associated protein Cas1